MEDQRLLTRQPQKADDSRRTATLPPILLAAAVKRLEIAAWVMLSIYFVGWFLSNALAGHLQLEFSNPFQWGGPVTGIVASIGVILAIRSRRLSDAQAINIGLVFEVLIAWAIPISHLYGTFRNVPAEMMTGDLVNISPVALWMLFFAALIPARPAPAFVALLLSAAAVPTTMVALILHGDAPVLPVVRFCAIFVFPYLITATMAYISARIIYGMGKVANQALQMGSYQLLDRLGAGGMGEVWRARHHYLARPAAVKLIRPDVLGGDTLGGSAVARFEREAQTTAKLQSPHTVQLYDYGLSDSGTFYYVMELLDGIDLQSLVDRFGPLPAERVVHVLVQTCHSLGEAHRHGLIHRDIKPANLFVCHRAFEYDFVKVLDFGLVKESDTRGSNIDLTASNAVAGTPAYIAPEIVLGKDVDNRCDLYALGCVAFWMLTARKVFEEVSVTATLVAHAHNEPPTPSSCTELPVPPELDEIVLSCLQKDPANRPQDAAELAARLDGGALSATWNQQLAEKWWQSHRPQVGRHIAT